MSIPDQYLDDEFKAYLEGWEGFDETLTYQENLIEMQIEMGFLDEARLALHNIKNQYN